MSSKPFPWAQINDAMPPLAPPQAAFPWAPVAQPAQAAQQGKVTPLAMPSQQSSVWAPSQPQVKLADDPLRRQEGSIQNKLEADQRKDANPFGSANNHPGFLGRVGHIAAKVGNIAGDVFLPRVMANIPGTDLNRSLEEGSLQGELGGVKQEEAKNALDTAQTAEAQANANAKEKPPAPSEEWSPLSGFTGPNGEPLEYEKHSGKARIAEGVTGAKQIPKAIPEGETPLGASVSNLNAALQDRYQILHPGQALPDQYKLPATATQKDYDRIDKALNVVEAAEGTLEQRKQTEALRQQAMALAAGNRNNKQDTAARAQIYKTYAPAMDSAERFNVMTKNAEDALRDHNQQAMLSLLANHLGMTMGLQKGARITRDTYKEAQESTPWLQDVLAKFDKDGFLSGVTLTPQQIHQMVGLAQDRYREDVTKSRNEAKYLGSTDDGPERTPSKATINYYTHLAGGDPQKAKQLASEDGWSIQ